MTELKNNIKGNKSANLKSVYPHKISDSYQMSPPEAHDTLEFVRRLDDVEVLQTNFQNRQKMTCGYTRCAVYEYRCYLCGRTFKFLDSDILTKLRVHPATKFGSNARNGYWSEGHCGCHKTSSFHWAVIDILEKHNVKYRTEVCFSDLVRYYDIPLRFDVCVWTSETNYSLIECQGEQHYKPVGEFGGEEKFALQTKYDDMKREYCKKHGIRLIEIARRKNNQYKYIVNTLHSMGII